jgi:hypothetical protein
MPTEMIDFLCDQLDPDPTLWAKRVYKGTDCGAWITVKGATVTLGSIVEGSHYDVNPRALAWPFTKEDFWNALEEIEQEAQTIWDDTHGCEGCAEKWKFIDDNGFPVEGGDGLTSIHPDCPECKGEGIII